MYSYVRAAALSALAFAASQAASAGFVYQTAARDVSVSVGGSVVDSESSMGLGSWFGNAASTASLYTALAQQGSGLSLGEMTFVGAAQIDSSGAAVLSANSVTTVTFLADSTESIRWMADLWREASGAGNSASISMSVIDVASGAVLLGFTAPVLSAGSFDVVAGRTYQLNLIAVANTNSASKALSNYNVGFFSSVPSPGAIALIGLAGLTTRRRR
jgi:hypothetical protein